MNREIRVLSLGLVLAGFLVAACAPKPAPPKEVPTVKTGVDPDAWVRVPAGEFLFGLHNDRMVLDYDYEIMKTPVTNAQWARFLNQALHDSAARNLVKLTEEGVMAYYPGEPYHGGKHEERIDAGWYLAYPLYEVGQKVHLEGDTFVVAKGFENHPATFITYFGAWAYCRYYGYRIPTEAEWEKAARGTDGRAYPWGDEIGPAYANYRHSRDPFEKYWGGLGETTPVGFYNGKTYFGFKTENAASPYGAYDMAGNVWEWVSDDIEETHQRILKGGSFADYEIDCRATWRNFAPPEITESTVGFRCVRAVPADTTGNTTEAP